MPGDIHVYHSLDKAGKNKLESRRWFSISTKIGRFLIFFKYVQFYFQIVCTFNACAFLISRNYWFTLRKWREIKGAIDSFTTAHEMKGMIHQRPEFFNNICWAGEISTIYEVSKLVLLRTPICTATLIVKQLINCLQKNNNKHFLNKCCVPYLTVFQSKI